MGCCVWSTACGSAACVNAVCWNEVMRRRGVQTSNMFLTCWMTVYMGDLSEGM